MSTIAPLVDFPWRGGDFDLAGGVAIRRRSGDDLLAEFREQVDGLVRSSFESSTYSLEVDDENEYGLRPSEIVQLFLLAAWIVVPRGTYVAFRFKREADAVTISHYLDRFQGIPDQLAQEDWLRTDLQSVAEVMAALGHAARSRGRVYMAATMAVAACEAVRWRVSYLCQAVSLETLLTYRHGRDLKRQLSIAFAALVTTDPGERQSAYEEFRDVYKVRSRMVHGEIGDVSSAENIARLAGIQRVARQLWKVISGERDVLAALELEDVARRTFIEGRCAGWRPTT